MTINRSNISTSVDGTDIFAISTANSPFTNLGNLSTSGDFSSPIHGSSDGVTIINKGSLLTTGEGSVGIAAYDSADFFVKLQDRPLPKRQPEQPRIRGSRFCECATCAARRSSRGRR